MKRRYISCLLLIILLFPNTYLYSVRGTLQAPPPDLHLASYNGNLREARELLKRGADINASDSMLQTPLMVSSAQGHLHMVKYFLRKKADPLKQNYMGETALMLAVQGEHTEVAKLLLRRGASPAATDNKGWTALMLSRSAAMSAILIREGADVNYRVAGSGITALMVAAQEGNTGLVRILLQAGADKDTADHRGMTARGYALQRGHSEIAGILQ